MTSAFPGCDRLLGRDELRALHAVLLGQSTWSDWRTEPLHREGFDADGKATGLIFPTLPARLVGEKTEELLTWLELELRSGERHAILVVGTFLLYFLAISPFERGNGRLARLLTVHLLRRAGYGFISSASLEREFEDLRSEYQQTLLHAQTKLWTGGADLEGWLGFFLEVFDRQRKRVETKLTLEREARDYPPLQRAILETVREHGDVDAGLLLKATGANRNTLKDNLRRLVQGGVLEKMGQRRGTRYRMSTGEPARVGAEGSVER
jgi:Fic family protein